MSADQAGQICRFINQHKDDIGTVVVHCERGMSRSAAVAAALCASLGGDEEAFFREFQPNGHVYRLVRNAAVPKREDETAQ
jgi:protein-tyrosine phosphatase